MTLNPCPFCGGTPELQTQRDFAWTFCLGCGVRSQVLSSSEAAISAWNTRAEQPQHPSSLRDDIACEVLRAALPRLMTASLMPEALDATARFSYAMADAMMKARS